MKYEMLILRRILQHDCIENIRKVTYPQSPILILKSIHF